MRHVHPLPHAGAHARGRDLRHHQFQLVVRRRFGAEPEPVESQRMKFNRGRAKPSPRPRTRHERKRRRPQQQRQPQIKRSNTRRRVIIIVTNPRLHTSRSSKRTHISRVRNRCKAATSKAARRGYSGVSTNLHPSLLSPERRLPDRGQNYLARQRRAHARAPSVSGGKAFHEDCCRSNCKEGARCHHYH